MDNKINESIFWNPLASERPVFEKTIVVNCVSDAMQTLNMNPNGIDDLTDLDDVDDEMELNTEIPIMELPQRDFNIRTLTQEKLDEMRKETK